MQCVTASVGASRRNGILRCAGARNMASPESLPARIESIGAMHCKSRTTAGGQSPLEMAKTGPRG